ncbi:hypothetical protein MUK42_34728 [Musa troglodytarum]|uniref:Uncharacterized protein n=1 Tax=Musa troglodytarum TaxID=320322 RepID=A0A9E7FSI4_9LILI|nr:hypothetical protein MUK42_34728 [Musa troglodytarum]
MASGTAREQHFFCSSVVCVTPFDEMCKAAVLTRSVSSGTQRHHLSVQGHVVQTMEGGNYCDGPPRYSIVDEQVGRRRQTSKACVPSSSIADGTRTMFVSYTFLHSTVVNRRQEPQAVTTPPAHGHDPVSLPPQWPTTADVDGGRHLFRYLPFSF